MSAVIEVALPVFAIILAGYLAGRFHLLSFAATEVLNRFVHWVALPPLMFLSMAQRPVAETVNGPFVAIFLGSMTVIFAVGAVMGRLLHRQRPAVVCEQGLNASLSNAPYLGIPLFLAAFGPDHLAPAILATCLTSIIMAVIAVIMLELAQEAGLGLIGGLRDIGRSLVTNPLVVAPLLGILWSVALGGMPMPKPIAGLATLLGAAAAPCALTAVGLFLAGQTFKADWGEIGWIVALKLLWQPVLAWLVIDLVFSGMDPFWARAAVIIAALPTGALTFIISSRYEVYVERTAAALLASTVAGFATLSIVLAISAH